MRGIAGLFGATLIALLLTTCGTYRAVTDDYASDAPVVQDVKPTSGVSGEQVTFDVFLCIGKAFTGEERYIWNFGNGAYPNVSYDAQPTVKLRNGATEPYQCSVMITGGCVGDDDVSATYEFTLAVAPLTVIAVTPLTGTGLETATFSAQLGTGVAENYLWDFGGACSPGGSNEQNPTVSFVNVTDSSLYNCKLIVSNQFEVVQYNFTINVLKQPAP